MVNEAFLSYLKEFKCFALSHYVELTNGYEWDHDQFVEWRGKDQGAAMFLSFCLQHVLTNNSYLKDDWEIKYGLGEDGTGLLDHNSGEMLPHCWLEGRCSGLIIDIGSEFATGESVRVVPIEQEEYLQKYDSQFISQRLMAISSEVDAVAVGWEYRALD